MLTSEEARHVLGLTDAADTATARERYEQLRTQITERLASAPTEGLRGKYQQQLGELVSAYEVLTGGGAGGGSSGSGLSQTQLGDLPGAAPSYTQHGYGAGAGAAVKLKAGDVLADRYELRREIGSGGMGVVYEAYDRVKGESIALKVLQPHLLTHEKARERFLSEAKIACKLAHSHIVKVFDVGYSAPYHFITMELLEGRTLREEIEAYRSSRQDYPVERAVECAKQLIGALEHAHKRIVHRDLKPENVWVEEDGTFKLMDFGIARALTTTELTKTGKALGTAYYMAPEQLAGEREIDGRADQYSLGVMLYELLTGRIPQGAIEAPVEIRSEVPKGLSAAVMKALSARREQRFETLAEMAEALEKRGIAVPQVGLSGTLLFSVFAVVAIPMLAIVGGLVLAAVEAGRASRMGGDGVRMLSIVALAGALVGAIGVGIRRSSVGARNIGVVLLVSAAILGGVAGWARFATLEHQRNYVLDVVEKIESAMSDLPELLQAARLASPRRRNAVSLPSEVELQALQDRWRTTKKRIEKLVEDGMLRRAYLSDLRGFRSKYLAMLDPHREDIAFVAARCDVSNSACTTLRALLEKERTLIIASETDPFFSALL